MADSIAYTSIVMSATPIRTSCSSASFAMYFCAAVPKVISATFFAFCASFISAASTPSSSSNDPIEGDSTSSINFCAAGRRASRPDSALFIMRPGMSMRLISFVPSKMRLMRESR